MSGRAETRTPEPPDRDEHENSPPRLARPKRTTRPPAHYAQEQEIDTEQRNTRSQRKKKNQGKPVAQREAATSDDSLTESEESDTSKLVKQIVKLRREIRRRDELHKEELQRVKEEFGAALAEFRQELQTLANRSPTPQSHPESCAQDSHEEILREIQSLRIAVSPTGSPSYADVARTPPTSQPSNIRTLSSWNTTPTTFTDTLYCTIDTPKMAGNENERPSAGPVRRAVETEIRAMENYTNWRCRAVTVDPKNTNRIRIACRDEAEHQLVKKVAETKVGAGARVLRDELYPIKVDSVNRTAVLDENGDIRVGAAAAFGEENEATIAKIAWLSRKGNAKAYGSMVIYLTKGSDARRLLADGFFHAGGESGVTSTFEYRPRPIQCYNCQEIGHKAFQCKNAQRCAKCAAEGHHHTKTVGSSTRHSMNKTLRAIQLNVRKQGAVHESLMNDEETQNAVALAIQEPQARRIQGRLLTIPMGHHKWTRMVPSTWREGRGGTSTDRVPGFTAAVIRLPERLIFMASVYVEGGNASALDDACNHLLNAITKVRRDTGAVVEIVIMGDFNRHDQLWGGDDVSLGRQGEADPIIDLMNECALSSLLKRGTKTWGGYVGRSGASETLVC
ncbi:hypothetical protein CNMCM8694_005650 [Aspergillus lentulus]|nr:hypothetical protein CNMCM8060_006258 [Aspergillus lentulus]KAF4195908.1 hypothetical protein CNMCM8694_005650 [Aspergillus lentulus]